MRNTLEFFRIARGGIMETINFEYIFGILQSIIPNEWNSIVFYAQYSKGSYSMKYYVNFGNSEYIDCFKLNGITRSEIIKSFIRIDVELSKCRNCLDEDKKWSVLTFQVDNTGKFKTDFEYSDISENTIQYFEEWRKRFLK